MVTASLHNIVLLGFMGTGKSTVGQLLADHLQWTLVETDAEIERREDRPIARIFETEGEAYFREVERRVVAECSWHKAVVLSCGGGVVLNPLNIWDLQQHGLLVCLQADEEAILARVRHDIRRPLLESEDKGNRIRDLLRERKALYDRLPHQVDTTGKTPGQIRDEILRLWDQAAS